MTDNSNFNHLVNLRKREFFKDNYQSKYDPICEKRLGWRSQTFRHLVHCLPAENVLELGSGSGMFTTKLKELFPEKLNITSIHFQENLIKTNNNNGKIISYKKSFTQFIQDSNFFEKFDYIVGIDVLDSSSCSWLLTNLKPLLKEGGKIIFFESNPWNPILNIKKFLGLSKDHRCLLSKIKLYELFSEIGYIKIFSFYNDFLYGPLAGKLLPYLKNISVLLENMPVVQKFAGSITIHAQKSDIENKHSFKSLANHQNLFNSVSIVVPCHNEEKNVQSLIESLFNYFNEYIHEVIIVNDNSSDNTKHIVNKLKQTNTRVRLVNRTQSNGVGRALREGYSLVKGEYCLTMDCDFQHLITEFVGLFDALNQGVDMVIGSRFSQNSILLNYPFTKILFNRMFHFSLAIFTRNQFRDLTNNLKIMKKEVLDNIPVHENGFAANAETGIYPILLGYNVCEVPMSWVNRDSQMGISSFKLIQVGKGYLRVFLKALKYKYFNTKL